MFLAAVSLLLCGDFAVVVSFLLQYRETGFSTAPLPPLAVASQEWFVGRTAVVGQWLMIFSRRPRLRSRESCPPPHYSCGPTDPNVPEAQVPGHRRRGHDTPGGPFR